MYATSSSGAKRIVFLLETETGEQFFLFYRDKNDIIGENITIKNTYFREALYKYLEILAEDIEQDQIEEIDL